MLKKVIDLKGDVAVLDLGTDTICASIARFKNKKSDVISLNSENEVRVAGVGYQLAKGIKKGAITNLDELEDSLLNAISTAEKEAQKSIKSLFIALPSWAFESKAIGNAIDIGQLPVDDIHINSLLNFDISEHASDSMEIIHIFPVSYSIDENDGIQDPLGMVGNKLSVVFHVLTAKSSLVRNLKNCLNRNNIEVEGFVNSTYASGLSVLLKEETTSGITLIDIGGSSSSVACYLDGKLLYLGTVPLGGNSITRDISTILRTSLSNAERLKILYGVSSGVIVDDEQILVSKLDEYGEEHIQNVSKIMLDSIVCARLEEILNLIQNHISECGADKSIYQKIVITGGGSRISGLSELIKAKRFFADSSVRLGKPIGTIGSHDFVQSASFATSSGIVLYYTNEFLNNTISQLTKKSLWKSISSWLRRGD